MQKSGKCISCSEANQENMQLNDKLSSKSYMILEEKIIRLNHYRSLCKRWVSLGDPHHILTMTQTWKFFNWLTIRNGGKIKYSPNNDYCYTTLHKRRDTHNEKEKLPFSFLNSCSGYRSISPSHPINTEMSLKVFSLCRAWHFTRLQPRCEWIRFKY